MDKKNTFKEKFLRKFQIVIFDEKTHEEYFSKNISKFNVLIFTLLSVFAIAYVTFLSVAYTPLKNNIPGFASSELRKQAIHLFYQVDSLQRTMEKMHLFTETLQTVLKGDQKKMVLKNPIAEIVSDFRKTFHSENRIDTTSLSNYSQKQYEKKIKILEQQLKLKNKKIQYLNEQMISHLDSTKTLVSQIKHSEIDSSLINYLTTSKKDTDFRDKIESQERFNIFEFEGTQQKKQFISPLIGEVVENYNIEKNHFGVKVEVRSKTPIRAVLKGVVVFADWVSNRSYVVVIAHEDEYLSIYKNNDILYKEKGDFVSSGEVISEVLVKNKPNAKTILGFELWHKGYTINPLDLLRLE